jgi:1-acyl-sn-glycerol-3-phosphate acyltransferase
MSNSEMRSVPGDASGCGRAPLVDAITMFLVREHASRIDEIRACLEQALDEAGPDAFVELGDHLARAGSDWDYFPRDPLARRIHHALADPVLQHPPQLVGLEYLDIVAGKPVVMFPNHLSYSDANVLDVLLQRAGASALTDRLTVIAGPKVYSSVRRRFSSLCFGTIKVPQSTTRSSDEAVMTARDVAHAAQRALQVARDRLRLGEALLVFAEGNRSRSGQLQPLLPGVARYLDSPGTWVLPVGIVGTERLFPVGDDSLYSGLISLTIGRPVLASTLRERARRDRRIIMDSIGFAIADLLPHSYRGVYADVSPELAPAHSLFESVWNASA